MRKEPILFSIRFLLISVIIWFSTFLRNIFYFFIISLIDYENVLGYANSPFFPSIPLLEDEVDKYEWRVFTFPFELSPFLSSYSAPDDWEAALNDDVPEDWEQEEEEESLFSKPAITDDRVIVCFPFQLRLSLRSALPVRVMERFIPRLPREWRKPWNLSPKLLPSQYWFLLCPP